MGRFRDADLGAEDDRPADAALVPWIDAHGHHHTLAWRDHEEFALAGCLGFVMAGGLENQSPYRPMRAEDVRTGWDRAIRASHALSRSHLVEAYAAVGVHTSVGPVAGVDELLDHLPAYAALEEVVALSETGISMVQEHEAVPLDDQRPVVREQLAVAADAGLPAVLHTPTTATGESGYDRVSADAEGGVEPVLDPETAKVEAARIDLELADEAGLPEDRIAFTHAHRSMVPWVLDETDCYASFTVGNATRDVRSEDVAAAIEAYGPDRLVLDADVSNHKKFEPMAVKRTVLDLLRLGMDPADVRTVAYENARDLLGLDDLPP